MAVLLYDQKTLESFNTYKEVPFILLGNGSYQDEIKRVGVCARQGRRARWKPHTSRHTRRVWNSLGYRSPRSRFQVSVRIRLRALALLLQHGVFSRVRAETTEVCVVSADCPWVVVE